MLLALYIWLGWLTILLLPFITGVLRQVRHRCQKCLNNFKAEGYFEQLNDKILEFEVYNFGVIIRRKTMVQGLVFVVACLLLGGALEWQSIQSWKTEIEVDTKLTWELFQTELRQGEGNYKANRAF